MGLTVVWIAGEEPHEPWLAQLAARAPQHTFLGPGGWDAATPADVALVGGPPSAPFAAPASVRLVQSVWAGVDSVLPHVPAALPLARLVDEGMAATMTEAVLAHVLAAHREHDELARAQARAEWRPTVRRHPADRVVGVLGLGSFGRPAAIALRDHGFDVRGWSARPGVLPGIRTFAGDAELAAFLGPVEIAVCLLPLTDATRGILDERTLGLLPRGAVLINLARGPLLAQGALLAALDSGAMRHAVLDVFDVEPLPGGHPYWAHDRITVTPHVAAPTPIRSGVEAVLANLERVAAGAPPLHLVDRDRGY
jgi:glyoxylate/hydroxypyruvate reductase A